MFLPFHTVLAPSSRQTHKKRVRSEGLTLFALSKSLKRKERLFNTNSTTATTTHENNKSDNKQINKIKKSANSTLFLYLKVVVHFKYCDVI